MLARTHPQIVVFFLIFASSVGASLTLQARAEVPVCRYDTTTDTVLDRTTKLTWQRKFEGTSMTHQKAQEYCSKLITDGGGFRLPSVKELQTIVDVLRSAPAIDTTAFPDVPSSSSAYWTETTYAKDNTNAWYVQFVDGSVYWKPRSETMYVRCVKAK
jgi:Protein of unknown function (DUF1566)